MNLLNQIQSFEVSAPLPASLLVVRQQFEQPQPADVAAATVGALEEIGLARLISPGDTVALGVGSRGISNLPLIVSTAVGWLRDRGAAPFIVPAMGSHGGATAEGQTEMLAQLGIRAETVDAEIRATMEVTVIGEVADGLPAYQDVISAEADHTLLINRVKPHTSFRSTIESGLAKMAVIGLGKQQGAATMHSQGVEALRRFIAPAARLYQANSNLRGGLAIVENAAHQTAFIAGLTAAEIGAEREAALLERATALMARLPFPEIEVLVVRQLGKNISGTGMDTNVIGRFRIPRQPEPDDGPDIAVIAVLDATEQTHGNTNGLGLANVTTARLARKIDWQAMYTNAISSGVLGMWRAHLPLTLPDDRRALQVALRGCGRAPETARLVFIENTLALDRLWVSPNLRRAVEAHPHLALEGEAPLDFTPVGAMTSPWQMPSEAD